MVFKLFQGTPADTDISGHSNPPIWGHPTFQTEPELHSSQVQRVLWESPSSWKTWLPVLWPSENPLDLTRSQFWLPSKGSGGLFPCMFKIPNTVHRYFRSTCIYKNSQLWHKNHEAILRSMEKEQTKFVKDHNKTVKNIILLKSTFIVQ